MSDSKKGARLSIFPKDKDAQILFVSALFLSLCVIAVGICYIVGCVSIYMSGSDAPFSRGSVGKELKWLIPISAVLILLIIAAGILSLCLKAPKKKMIPIKPSVLLRIVEKRLVGFAPSDEYSSISKTEKKKRKTILITALSVTVAAYAMSMIFVLDPSRYSTTTYNSDIAYAILIVGVASVVAFGAVFSASMLNDSSYKRQTAYAKEELLRMKAGELSPLEIDKEALLLSGNSGHTALVVRLVIILVAVLFIILGIFNGGMQDVLGKAVRICTECIGLG